MLHNGGRNLSWVPSIGAPRSATRNRDRPAAFAVPNRHRALGLEQHTPRAPRMGLGAPQSADSALLPTDMEVEVEDSLLMDHEAPAEKTDADFFNGARGFFFCFCPRAHADAQCVPPPQTFPTTLTTRIWTEK